VELPDARVRYTDSSIGVSDLPPVVMIHGFGASLETWVGVAPLIGKTRRVITLDLKGFGGTDRPEGDYSPPAQARLVLALLDKLGVKDRFAVVAHSWGSSVALQIALLVPERVTASRSTTPGSTRTSCHDVLLGAGAAPGDPLRPLLRPDAEYKLAAAFYDKRYVTQQMVDDVERVLAFPGTTPPPSPRCAACATRRSRRSTARSSSGAPDVRPRGHRHPGPLRRAAGAAVPNAHAEILPRAATCHGGGVRGDDRHGPEVLAEDR
jgi:pimeloyl-ACP methyl ester carboxylesterase